MPPPPEPEPTRAPPERIPGLLFIYGLLLTLLLVTAWQAWRRPVRYDANMIAGVEPPPIMLLDVNAATADELTVLPGIGPALAERIVEDRAARGPFASIEDLERVPGIGPRTILRVRELVTVKPPAAPSDGEADPR